MYVDIGVCLFEEGDEGGGGFGGDLEGNGGLEDAFVGEFDGEAVER